MYQFHGVYQFRSADLKSVNRKIHSNFVTVLSILMCAIDKNCRFPWWEALFFNEVSFIFRSKIEADANHIWTNGYFWVWFLVEWVIFRFPFVFSILWSNNPSAFAISLHLAVYSMFQVLTFVIISHLISGISNFFPIHFVRLWEKSDRFNHASIFDIILI